MSDTRAEARLEDTVREVEAVLIRRIQEVERQNEQLRDRTRKMMFGTGVVLAIASLMLVLSFSKIGFGGVAQTVEAHNFLLRDADGLIRAKLTTGEDGSTRFALQDRDGRERAQITLLPDGSPGITLADRDARPRAVLGFLPDQTANLVFADAGGRPRTVLGLSPGQSSNLVFSDRAGDTRVTVGVSQDGTPDVSVYDQQLAAPATEPEATPADSVAPAGEAP